MLTSVTVSSVVVPAVDQVTVTGHPFPWLVSAMSTCSNRTGRASSNEYEVNAMQFFSIDRRLPVGFDVMCLLQKL